MPDSKVTGTWPELGDIPDEIAHRALPEVVEAVAEIAQGLAPSRTGRLRKSIRPVVLQGGEVGAVQATARHAHLIHDGTRSSGKIKLRKAKHLLIPTSSGVVFRQSSTHVGITANPFLDKARDASIPVVEEILARTGQAVMDEVAG